MISTIWRVVFFEREDLPCGAVDPAPPSSVPPKVLESVGRHFGVSDGVLNVLVPEVMLQRPRVVAIIGELKTTGMAQHVRVDREWHLGGLADVYAKTLLKRRLESAMNSILANCKNSVCDKSC